MRIRKTVSKLLGSTMALPSHHSPPRPDSWAPPAIDASAFVCELNQSPWDAYPNLHLFKDDYFQVLESSIILKKEEAAVESKEEMQKIITESTGSITKNSEKSIRFCKKSIYKQPKKKIEKMMKKNVIILCKKNDGKKWFCKRPARPPHSLCEYHLAQSRYYYNTNKEKEASQFNAECTHAEQKQKSKGNSDTGASSPYYYYNGFGYSTRKRKGGMSSGRAGHDAVHASGEERVDGCDVSGTGIDEESDDEVADKLVPSLKEEVKKVSKKKGRRPMKFRSLKSLL